MKKRGKFIAIGLLILLLVLAGIVFFGWKLGKGPLAYLKYDTFHLGEVVYGITEEEVFCQNGQTGSWERSIARRSGRGSRGS